MRELSDAMNEAFEQRARAMDGLAPSARDLSGMRRQVRRRRVLRHTAEAAVVVPVVAALAVGGLWLTAEGPTPPPAETPTVEPTPTESPEPTETPDPGEDLGAPVLRPGFAPFHELPDGVLAQTGPGWVVATVVPVTTDMATSEHTEEGVFLIRPDGTRFLVRWLPTGLERDGTTATWTQHDVVRFDPAAGTVLLNARHWTYTYAGDFVGIEGSVNDAAGDLVELDVETGEMQTVGSPPEGANQLVGVVGDDLLWAPHPEGEDSVLFLSGPSGVREIDTQAPSGGAVEISPDGRLAVTGRSAGEIEVVDLVAGESREVAPRPAEGSCSVLAWWDEQTLAVVCTDDAGDEELVTYDAEDLAAGPTPVWDVRSIEIQTWGAARLADGRLAVAARDATASGECTDGVYLVSGRESALLVADMRTREGIYDTTVVGGVAYVTATTCNEVESPRTPMLLAVDPATGTVVELVADAGPEYGGAFASSLSYAVAD
ncbi:hypothetical protein [Cellulomonas sp. APG4]|uniref:hypothetical protein n=1 Tax=Cellulomonas sp. APG4 TaxID=1538656 RepID=UPI00192A249D|nr:hypothetical protein [Cellulomonas sp. APG4]